MRRATYSCTSLFPYKLPIPATKLRDDPAYVRTQRAQGHSFWSTKGHNSAGTRAGWTDVRLRLNCLGSNTPEASKVPAYSSALLLLLNLLWKRAGKELEVGSSQCPANLGFWGPFRCSPRALQGGLVPSLLPAGNLWACIASACICPLYGRRFCY